MKRFALAVLTVVVGSYLVAAESDNASFQLKQTIPLPGVEGRIDHFDVDTSGQRLFVCALGNNTVEVIDLNKGERIHTISGLGAPQGVAFVPERIACSSQMIKAECATSMMPIPFS